MKIILESIFFWTSAQSQGKTSPFISKATHFGNQWTTVEDTDNPLATWTGLGQVEPRRDLLGWGRGQVERGEAQFLGEEAACT